MARGREETKSTPNAQRQVSPKGPRRGPKTRLKKLGKPAGNLTGNEDEARRYIDWGYLFVAVGSDVGLLAKAADTLAKKFKPA